MKKIIGNYTAQTLSQLIALTEDLNVTNDPDIIYIEGSNGRTIHFALQEETLTDGSIVYNIIISEEKERV